MKKNDHVEFTGKLPKELKKTNKPLYGTVVKMIGKSKAEIKPRYKRFTVSVLLTDLTKVKEEKFTKKRTTKKPENPTISKKAPVNKPVAKKCVTPVKLKEAVKEAKAEVKEETPIIPISKPTPAVEPADVPDEPSINWAKEHPINKPEPIPKPTPEVEPTSPSSYHDDFGEQLDENVHIRGGVIIWGLVAVVTALALITYFYFT